MKYCKMRDANEYEQPTLRLKLRLNDTALLYGNIIIFQYYNIMMQKIMQNWKMHVADKYEELKLRLNDAALFYDNIIII
jgi:hypothetical protein